MDKQELHNLKMRYQRDGFLSGIPIIEEEKAQEHRHIMEAAEKQLGSSLHYKSKIHTLLSSPWQLATFPQVLDIVEQLIGPNILLYNVTYIIKEADSASHVSWHQDLTYWGLSGDDQVSMWLALSPATGESGCMRMIPGSHLQGCVEHNPTEDPDNVLLQGQTVSGIHEEQALLCPLLPGEASFHHGWTLHASLPNHSADRRIGLNIQYIATHIQQIKHRGDSALLVRGEDHYQHFAEDIPARRDNRINPEALAQQQALEAKHRDIAGSA